MGLLHLLVAALAASAAMAADTCACVNPVQTIDPVMNPMIFFQQPTLGGKSNGDKCSMNCDFVANLDVAADSNSTLQVQLLTNNLGDGAGMTVDGVSKDITITPSTPAQIFEGKSYGTQITIHFTEPSTTLSEFMIVVTKVQGRPDAPIIKSTTTAAPTPPYDPKFTHNPRLVANDIMLVFDLSSKNIDKYKSFAQGLIKELAINPKELELKEGEEEDCDAGSRLSVVGLSSIGGFDNLYAPYWTTSYTQADGNIGSMVQIASGNYFYGPVNEKYSKGFGKDFTTCKNRGKIFILMTSAPPQECDMSRTDCAGKPDQTPFLDLGVHQILAHYDMADKDQQYYKLYNTTDDNKRWNFFEMSGTDNDVEKFMNTYLVDSNDQMTCQLKAKTSQTSVPIGKDDSTPVKIDLPPYYKAKGVTDGVWTTDRHYCNFQDTTIQLTRDPSITGTTTVPKVPVCVKVFYDLETGKDFVSIFSGDPALPQKEVARLTGRDVSGTFFELPDAIGTIVFSSDEKNVYDGFHAEITRRVGDECV